MNFTLTRAALQYRAEAQAIDSIKVVAPAISTDLSFDALTQSYTATVTSDLIDPASPETRTFAPGEISTTLSDACFRVYRNISGIRFFELSLFKSSANPALSLSHSGFGLFHHWRERVSDQDVDFRPIAYGTPTPGTVPAPSGTQTYTGLFYGQASAFQAGSFANLPRQYRVIGELRLTVDFTARTISGSVKPIGIRAPSGGAGSIDRTTLVDLGTVALTQATPLASLQTLTGSAGSGTFTGFIAGPASEELAVSFTTRVTDPETGRTLELVGAGAARR